MQNSSAPSKFPIPFANAGTANAIPTPSQIGITTGAASLTDGFPPITFTPLSSGGQPPFGADVNGILKALSAGVRWSNAGGVYSTDSTFQGTIGGYPKGAIIANSTFDVLYQNISENNTTSPDSGGAGWKNLLGNFAAAQIYSFGTTLTWSDCGKVLLCSAGTYYLPLVSVCSIGSKITIRANGSVIISPQGSDLIFTATGVAGTGYNPSLRSGEWITLICSGSTWEVVQGADLNQKSYSSRVTAGLQFGNSTTISSNLNSNNALNWYEKGTFTPIPFGFSTAGTYTPVTASGNYQRVGNVVYYSLRISYTSHTGTGFLAINGLPFSSSNTDLAVIDVGSMTISAGSIPKAAMNSNRIIITYIGGGGPTIPTNLTDLYISGSYLV
jgi:hypothetical protein